MNSRGTGFWFGVWMLVFAAFGFWVTVTKYGFDLTHRYPDTITMILLVFIGAVAIKQLRSSRRRNVDDTPPKGLSDTWHIYVDAWKQLWSQKWLKWFFGIVFGTRLVGGLITLLIMYYYFGDEVQNNSGILSMFNHRPNFFGLQMSLPDWINTSLVNSLTNFNPIFFISNNPVISLLNSIALLITAILIYPKLKELSADSNFDRGARMILISLVVFAFGILINAYSFILFLLNTSKSSYISNLFNINPPWDLIIYLAVSLLSAIFVYTISAGLFAGLVGSLIKTKREEPVSIDTFIRDIIRYMKPSALLYILFFVISMISQIQPLINYFTGNAISGPLLDWYIKLSITLNRLLTLLSMFIPFAIVYNMKGIKQGIKTGFNILRVNIVKVATFITLGLTLLTSVKLILEMIDFAIPGGPVSIPKSIVNISINEIADVIVMAVMTLAVWGLFLRLRGSDDEADVQEPPVTAAE